MGAMFANLLSNLYREPSIDISYQVSVNIGQAVALAEEKIFRK